jgi:dipeptidyl aminopeptidase/acylaminoacyl peptidase
MLQTLAVSLSALMLQAAEPTHPASLFGVRQSVEHASLSPDGKTLAFLGPAAGQGSGLYIVPVDGSAKPKVVVTAGGNPERVDRCNWVANDRLVCRLYWVTNIIEGEGAGGLAYMTRYVAVDSDGSNNQILYQASHRGLGYFLLYGGGIIDWLPDEDGNMLMTREHHPQMSTGTRISQREHGLGVDRVNTRTGKFSRAEAPREDAESFITDGRGTVRVVGLRMVQGGGYDSGNTRYLYRKKGASSWDVLSTVDDVHENGFAPHAVDPDLNVAYGLKRLNGRLAAYSVALDGSLREQIVFAHPRVDVAGFIGIGRRGRIVGVTYVTDRNETHYFDPQLDRLAKSLAKALPNLPLIHFVDSSVDESRLLIWAGSDTDPGRYFLYDKATKQLAELVENRPNLADVRLARVQAISYRAADGTTIPGYLTLPPGKESAKGLPAIVMPHGGPGARDEWGFDWLAQYYAHRGFAVLQPNFRGSAGYGEDWFHENGFQSWKVAIGDVNDGGRWLVSQGIADPRKMAIVGWSYGGYAALQSAATEPGLFGAVVAVAPVTDLALLKEERRYWSNFNVVSRYIGSGPHVGEGSPALRAADIKVPVMLFHGTQDRNVGIKHSQLMEARLKEANRPVELFTYTDRDHYLEDSRIRVEMLAKSDAFLRKSLGL